MSSSEGIGQLGWMPVQVDEVDIVWMTPSNGWSVKGEEEEEEEEEEEVDARRDALTLARFMVHQSRF